MQKLFAFIRICRLLYGVLIWTVIAINVVAGGDFNCPLDPTLDKKGGILIPRQHVINSIESFQNEFSLHDIWRVKNPKTGRYTWSKSSPFIFCRLN